MTKALFIVCSIFPFIMMGITWAYFSFKCGKGNMTTDCELKIVEQLLLAVFASMILGIMVHMAHNILT